MQYVIFDEENKPIKLHRLFHCGRILAFTIPLFPTSKEAQHAVLEVMDRCVNAKYWKIVALGADVECEYGKILSTPNFTRKEDGAYRTVEWFAAQRRNE